MGFKCYDKQKFLQAITALALLALSFSCHSSRRQSSGVNQHEAPRPATTQGKIICIDPGHPSEVNSGATVQNETTEVHIAWVVALAVKQDLEARGFRVVLTKSQEAELVTNKDRAFIANNAGAILMVRLHCDTGTEGGLALYFPDQQATKDGVTGPPRDIIERSKSLAEMLHTEMSKDLREFIKDGGVRGDSATAIGSKQGALTASIFSQVPIVTIEMVDLSNKADADFIKSEAGQKRMAHAISAGVAVFATHLPEN